MVGSETDMNESGCSNVPGAGTDVIVVEFIFQYQWGNRSKLLHVLY